MRATVIHAPHDIRVAEVPDPVIQQPTDVVLRVLRACICGSDLWAYRGESARQPGQRIGHEFLGIVEEAGSEVNGFSMRRPRRRPLRLVRRHLRLLRRGPDHLLPAGRLLGLGRLRRRAG